MRGFLQAVSNPDSDHPMASFDGYVDLPLRLAVLHGLLVDIISKKQQRQTSTEDLQIDGPEQEHEPGAAHPLDISSPQTVSDKQLVYCGGTARRSAEHAGGMWLRR
ncbi:unnamed protein product [Arctogadus glacialis]